MKFDLTNRADVLRPDESDDYDLTKVVTNAEQIAGRIRQALPNIKRGALRFWGNWFGRPYDNIHWIVDCEAEGDLLRVRFNEDEMLSVVSPRNASIDASTFLIDDASRVRWEWFYYGRTKTPENLCVREFTKHQDGSIVGEETNVDWPTRDLKGTSSEAAVEILELLNDAPARDPG